MKTNSNESCSTSAQHPTANHMHDYLCFDVDLLRTLGHFRLSGIDCCIRHNFTKAAHWACCLLNEIDAHCTLQARRLAVAGTIQKKNANVLEPPMLPEDPHLHQFNSIVGIPAEGTPEDLRLGGQHPRKSMRTKQST